MYMPSKDLEVLFKNKCKAVWSSKMFHLRSEMCSVQNIPEFIFLIFNSILVNHNPKKVLKEPAVVA